jgi:nitrite reductase/ring-hydroxylating ferredoxin subunit
MTEFTEVAGLDQVKPGASLLVRIGREEVALFNVEGTVYAIADSCAHAGASLAAGKIDGKFVTCRAHGFKYDVTTGFLGGDPAAFSVHSFPVKVVNDRILLAVPDAVPDGG